MILHVSFSIVYCACTFTQLVFRGTDEQTVKAKELVETMLAAEAEERAKRAAEREAERAAEDAEWEKQREQDKKDGGGGGGGGGGQVGVLVA